MEDGCLIGGHLMEAQLYTEWDDNYVCIIISEKAERNSYIMGNIVEKFFCDLKDHRQHRLTYFDKSLTLEIKNQMYF